LAPSPTGYLHLGHARTFWIAQSRAQTEGGTLILRNDDLDPARSKREFVTAMLEDLRWFGFQWQEGPDCGGPCAPYNQSERILSYRKAFAKLKATNSVYPCTCSRKDVLRAAQAPHAADDEVIYPGTCRGNNRQTSLVAMQPRANWRFRVPDGEAISFHDLSCGPQSFVAGKDFGDFVVWRHDDVPAYQLAAVADDAAMGITEVVRGADLLLSTARQLLLYRALRLAAPAFYHSSLLTDSEGVRLAKRHDAASLRTLRGEGHYPKRLREHWNIPVGAPS
jgi:glutamyl-tRNA synthetase